MRSMRRKINKRLHDRGKGQKNNLLLLLVALAALRTLALRVLTLRGELLGTELLTLLAEHHTLLSGVLATLDHLTRQLLEGTDLGTRLGVLRTELFRDHD